MISIAFIVIFVFCLAIAVGSILISHQFINTYNSDFHKNYFYFLVSFYAFALYAIWGHILIRVVLVELQTRMSVVEAAANFSSFLGLPFLIISWIMLINMSYSIFDKKAGKLWNIYHIAVFILLLGGILIGYDRLIERGVIEGSMAKFVPVAYLSAFGLINFLVFLAVIRFNSRVSTMAAVSKIQMFSILLAVAFLIQISSAFLAFFGVWFVAGATLLFFISNLMPLWYLRAASDDIFQPVKAEASSEASIEKLVTKYRITKRERQIVNQICQGKTNQQIADELFISLQTVKDHTHRIYSKIGINSRMQLVQLVTK